MHIHSKWGNIFSSVLLSFFFFFISTNVVFGASCKVSRRRRPSLFPGHRWDDVEKQSFRVKGLDMPAGQRKGSTVRHKEVEKNSKNENGSFRRGFYQVVSGSPGILIWWWLRTVSASMASVLLSNSSRPERVFELAAEMEQESQETAKTEERLRKTFFSDSRLASKTLNLMKDGTLCSEQSCGWQRFGLLVVHWSQAKEKKRPNK